MALAAAVFACTHESPAASDARGADAADALAAAAAETAWREMGVVCNGRAPFFRTSRSMPTANAEDACRSEGA